MPFFSTPVTTLSGCLVLPTLLVIAALLASPGMATAQQEPLIVTIDDYPPFYYWDDATPAGATVEILNEAFARMGVIPHYMKSSFVRSLDELREGRVHAALAGIRTPEREMFALYPQEPVYSLAVWVVTRKDDPRKTKSLKDLTGRTVGALKGYSYGNEFDAMTSFDRVYSSSKARLIMKLLEMRLDAIVGDGKQILAHANWLTVADRLDFRFKFFEAPLYLMLSRRHPEAADLALRFSDAMRTMQADGTLDRILKKASPPPQPALDLFR